MTIDCRDCHNCASDPDGLWCIKSLEHVHDCRPWGHSIERARSNEYDYCGPEAKLFKIAPDAMLKARGRLKENHDA